MKSKDSCSCASQLPDSCTLATAGQVSRGLEKYCADSDSVSADYWKRKKNRSASNNTAEPQGDLNYSAFII